MVVLPNLRYRRYWLRPFGGIHVLSNYDGDDGSFYQLIHEMEASNSVHRPVYYSVCSDGRYLYTMPRILGRWSRLLGKQSNTVLKWEESA
jgi:hypothetical protein